MQTHFEIFLASEAFYLLPQKAIFRPLKKELLISDIHLGKATHFRKNGIPMPAESQIKDLKSLEFLLRYWKPETVIILGDLFHSNFNKEWWWFKAFLKEYCAVNFVLVKGNHDILKNEVYEGTNLKTIKVIEEEDFIFSHEPINDSKKINFCGHIHPGIQISGIAKQSIKLPCFYFDNNQFILPAFGHLTGLYILPKKENAVYYLISNNTIFKYD